MITAMSLTNGTLTVVLDAGAQILTARNDHPKWKEIVEAFKSGNEAVLQALISLKAVVETYSVGELSVNSTGVTYRGKPMHSIDSNRVLAFLQDGLPYKPIANYMARKMANPSARAISELYNFLEHKNMPITPEGKIIAYKGVKMDFYSVHGNTNTVVVQGIVNSEGRLLNSVGTIIEVERSSVDDNFRNGCSFGLHAGSLAYARGWGQRVVLVEIDPADVVSVPEDCNCQKLRCCKYKIIGEYTGPMPEHFSSEFTSTEDEAVCSGCGYAHEDCDCEPEEDSNDLKGCCGGNCGCNPPTASAPIVIETKTVSEVRDSVENRIKRVVSKILEIDPIRIDDDTEWVADLGADSLDGVEIIMELEEEFKFEIGDNDAEGLANKPFSVMVDYIYDRVGSSQVPADTYTSGLQDGNKDRSAGKSPQYLAGDQNGADSELHARYIDGYVKGYYA